MRSGAQGFRAPRAVESARTGVVLSVDGGTSRAERSVSGIVCEDCAGCARFARPDRGRLARDPGRPRQSHEGGAEGLLRGGLAKMDPGPRTIGEGEGAIRLRD